MNINGSIISPYAFVGGIPIASVNKIATIPSFEIQNEGQRLAIAQIVEMQGWANRITKITKEQFYSLE